MIMPQIEIKKEQRRTAAGEFKPIHPTHTFPGLFHFVHVVPRVHSSFRTVADGKRIFLLITLSEFLLPCSLITIQRCPPTSTPSCCCWWMYRKRFMLKWKLLLSKCWDTVMCSQHSVWIWFYFWPIIMTIPSCFFFSVGWEQNVSEYQHKNVKSTRINCQSYLMTKTAAEKVENNSWRLQCMFSEGSVCCRTIYWLYNSMLDTLELLL